MITHPILQAKVDNLGMYHAIAKDLDEYNGGTDLMHDIGRFIETKPKKFTVCKLMEFHNFQQIVNEKKNIIQHSQFCVLFNRKSSGSTTRTIRTNNW